MTQVVESETAIANATKKSESPDSSLRDPEEETTPDRKESRHT